MKILIKNGFLLDMLSEIPNIRKTDILINNNIIEKIEDNINENVEKVIDANNKVVMPGLINTHTHAGMSIFRGYKDDKNLMDWLENAILPVEAKLTPEDIYWGTQLSCIEMIKSGTTTFCDMYFQMQEVIRSIEETGLRAVVGWSVTDDSIRDKYEKTIKYANIYNKENSRIKIYVSLHSGYTCSPETINKFLELAKQLNTGIIIHLAETQDEEKIIQERYKKRPVQYLNDLGVFNVPVVLAHGIYVSDEDIKILKNVNGGISHNPVSNCKLASGICDVVKLKENGLNVGLGTDGQGSTTTLDMFEEMRLCGYLQKVSKKSSICIKAYDILKMATIDGAKVLGLEKEIGTIEIGKKADIIIVDMNKPHLIPNNDICTNLVYSANGQDVETVIIDGKIIMENRKIPNINQEKIEENTRKIAKRVL